jgi:hypothetical protein
LVERRQPLSVCAVAIRRPKPITARDPEGEAVGELARSAQMTEMFRNYRTHMTRQRSR